MLLQTQRMEVLLGERYEATLSDIERYLSGFTLRWTRSPGVLPFHTV